jgi:hypothetical protein
MELDRDQGESRDDVDPAEALGGAAGLPLPEGQPRGLVPTDRDAPGTDVAPEALAEDGDPPAA